MTAPGFDSSPQALQVLDTLQAWRTQGWLRALDLALARFLLELDAHTPPSLLLAAAWLAHLEGRGHSGLPVAGLAEALPATLGWPQEASAALAEAAALLPADDAAAQQAWAGCSVLQINPPDATGSTPLVLQHGQLHLRRYWRYETQIATQVLQRALPDTWLAPPQQAQARALLARLFPTAAGAAAQTVAETTAADTALAESVGKPAIEPDWQQVACALALRGRLCLITGGPGTGKTYTAARLLVLMQALHAGPQPLRVALAAPTGKAAARLRQAMVAALQGLQLAGAHAMPGHAAQPDEAAAPLPLAAWAESLGPARTLHALLGTRPGTRRFVHDAAHPLPLDLLFVDEASMVHLEMMAALLQALPPGARLVLLGDRDQLASVEAGAVMGDLCAGAGAYTPATAQWVQALSGQVLQTEPGAQEGGLAQQTVVLRQSRRFAGPIGALALAVNRGDGSAALALLRQASRPHPEPPQAAGAAPALPLAPALALAMPAEAQAVARLAVQGRGGAALGYAAALQALRQRPESPQAFEPWALGLLTQFDRCRVLCAVREGPWGVAGLNAGIEAALVQQGLLQRRGEWYEGRPVMVTRNEAALGVFNGDIGLVLAPPGGGALRAWFMEGHTLRSVAISRLADVVTAFAMTVHKSQGSEFAHVLLVLPPEDNPVLTRELVYTGITRAKEAFTLVAPEPARLATACGRLTRRLSGLGAMLGGRPVGARAALPAKPASPATDAGW